MTIIKRTKDLKYIIKDNLLSQKRIWLFLILVNILWGLDPVIASELLKTSITLFSLTVLRFASVSIFLAVVIGLENLTAKEIKHKQIQFFNWNLLPISLSLFAVAFFTYHGLQETLPSHYLLLLRLYSVVFLGISLLKICKNKFGVSLLFTLPILGAMMLFIGEQDNWSVMSKVSILTGIAFFGIYSFLSGNFSKKFKVFLRYYRLQFFISIYCLILSGIAMFFFSFPVLSLREYVLGISFACVFTGLPHIIYFHLLKNIKDTTALSFFLSGSFFIALVTEILLFQIYPDMLKNMSVLFIYSGLSVMFYLYGRKQGLSS